MTRTALIIISFFCICIFGCSGTSSKASPSASVSGSVKKIAFNYHPSSAEELDYLSRFDIIVTHDPQDENTVKQIKSKGGKILFYEWLPAFYYCADPTPWQRLVYQNKDIWTLDPGDNDPNPMGDKIKCKDYFYDMADDGLISRRVEYLTNKAREYGYDGVFFDWGGGWYELNERKYTFLTDAFEKKHNRQAYEDKINQFIKKLKQNGLLVALNGGFRSENAKLDTYADIDIVESMFTADICDTSYDIQLTPEEQQKVCDTWFNTTQASLKLATQLPRMARAVNPNISFLFLNYAFPFYKETAESVSNDNGNPRIYERAPDRQAIFYGLAMSYLGNASGFTNGFDVSLSYVKDDVFFTQIGTPRDNVVKVADDVYLRRFSGGFVMVSERDGSHEVSVPSGVVKIIDLYSGNQLHTSHDKVTVTFTSETYPSGKIHPQGKIFIYGYQ